jgi:pyruvate dehydrogenase phosphatase
MGQKLPDGNWTAEILTNSHNGNVASEAQRIKDEHPGEPECLTRSRVLGAIAVTRGKSDLATLFETLSALQSSNLTNFP